MAVAHGSLWPGEVSGDREGKDSRVLAEVGVTTEGLRDLVRWLDDLRERFEA